MPPFLDAVIARVGRVARFVTNGDPGRSARFESITPELHRRVVPAALDRLRAIGRSAVRAAWIHHVRLLREQRVLVPDDAGLSGDGTYGKFCIGDTYKNAFCLTDRAKGWLELDGVSEASGMYYFAGRQSVSTEVGTLQLSVTQDREELILRRSLASVPQAWSCHYFPFPEKLQTAPPRKLRLQWDSGAGGKGVLVSTPVLRRKRPSRVVLVLVPDAIRPPADIGLYSGGNLTPNIDEYFRRAAQFPNSYAQSNWTLPTFASMATSQYASQHGVVDPDEFLKPIARDISTLAEEMKRAGFYTYGSMSHTRCAPSLGHHRGFDHFEYLPDTAFPGKRDEPQPSASSTVCRQITQLREYIENLEGVDFFGFMHFFDTHFPFKERTNRLHASHPLMEDTANTVSKKLLKGGLTREEREFVHAAYADKLKQLDGWLAQLFDTLRKRDRVTVILTSDHGYSYANSDGSLLDEDSVRTPFLVASTDFPVAAGRHRRFVESSVDLFATLGHLFDFGHDDRRRAGRAVIAKDGSIVAKEWASSEVVYKERYRLGLFADGRTSVVFDAPRSRASGRIDLAAMNVARYSVGDEPLGFQENTSRYLRELNISAAITSRALELIDTLALQGTPQDAETSGLSIASL